MPIYTYSCKHCGKQYEAFHFIDDRDNEVCCGYKPDRLISPTARPVIYEYFSENLNAQVTGPKQREQLMKERNLECVG